MLRSGIYATKIQRNFFPARNKFEILKRWYGTVIGKELGSIHNSMIQFRSFGIGFWNAQITYRSGIGAATPRNADFKGIHTFEFPSLYFAPEDYYSDIKFATFFQLFQLISKQMSESPKSVELELELQHKFQVHSIPKFANGIGFDGIVPMTAVVVVLWWTYWFFDTGDVTLVFFSKKPLLNVKCK